VCGHWGQLLATAAAVLFCEPIITRLVIHVLALSHQLARRLNKITGLCGIKLAHSMYDFTFSRRWLEECRLLGYENPVRSQQETHNFSATETSQIMLCKIRGFHGSDYEECLLLGYIETQFIPHRRHYVSAREPSRLILRKS
jgi:hypothetical protein